MATIYRHFDKEGTLLYIGTTANIFQRMLGHSRQSHWHDQIANITLEHCSSKKEAFKREAEAIFKETPLFNVRSQDPKSIEELRYAEAEEAYNIRNRHSRANLVYEALGTILRAYNKHITTEAGRAWFTKACNKLPLTECTIDSLELLSLRADVNAIEEGVTNESQLPL